IAVDGLPGEYVRVRSGIGDAPLASLLVVPVLFEGEVKGVIELGSLARFKPIHRVLLERLAESIGVVLNTVATTSRTEHLLEELKASNAELAKRTSDLEDKARQLALVSRYKSEFLANMSHELRTPLNSVLILARLLAENPRGSLNAEEVQYAATIHSSGQDLLSLINQILDLSKIESGRLQVDVRPVKISEVAETLERTFRPTLTPGIAFSLSRQGQHVHALRAAAASGGERAAGVGTASTCPAQAPTDARRAARLHRPARRRRRAQPVRRHQPARAVRRPRASGEQCAGVLRSPR